VEDRLEWLRSLLEHLAQNRATVEGTKIERVKIFLVCEREKERERKRKKERERERD
jgi:hypothetical protein